MNSQKFQFFKFWKKKTLHATHLFKLLEKMCKYEMDPTSIVEDTEQTRFCPLTDGWTDGQTDKVKSVYPPFNFVEARGIIKINSETFKGHNVNWSCWIAATQNIIEPWQLQVSNFSVFALHSSNTTLFACYDIQHTRARYIKAQNLNLNSQKTSYMLSLKVSVMAVFCYQFGESDCIIMGPLYPPDRCTLYQVCWLDA